jgi:hypothetical protein
MDKTSDADKSNICPSKERNSTTIPQTEFQMLNNHNKPNFDRASRNNNSRWHVFMQKIQYAELHEIRIW